MAKKKTAKAKDADEAIDFEASLAEVEQIVSQLESGQLNLTDSLKQYELGIKRLKQCHQLLEAAEQRVSQLAGFDADGNPITEPLSDPDQTKPGTNPNSPPGSVDDSPGLF